MKIYLVVRTDDLVDYDEYDAFVVMASGPKRALELCSKNAAGEGAESWRQAKVTLLGYSADATESKNRVILGSFNAG